MPYGTVLSDGAGVSGVLLEDADVWGGIFVLSSGGFSYLARRLSCSVMIFCISEFISDRRLTFSRSVWFFVLRPNPLLYKFDYLTFWIA